MTEILWTPSEERRDRSNLKRFIDALRGDGVLDMPNYESLYQWSVRHPDEFWPSLVKFLSPQFSGELNPAFREGNTFSERSWFPDLKLSFAQNFLRHRGERESLVFRAEDGTRRAFTSDQFVSQVFSLRSRLKAEGLQQGDRVVALIPNLPEAVIAMTAATSLGAVWSSCSPDFGVPGAVDRFGPIEPTIFFCGDGYLHKGSWIDSLQKGEEIRRQLPTVRKAIAVPYRGGLVEEKLSPEWIQYSDLIQGEGKEEDLPLLPFSHPLYIMFSSGTTGKPKCIVHGAGNTLIEHLKELVLHTDLKPEDTIFYQTTCGWMMWNWLVSGLAAGARVLLYDGSPLADDNRMLLRLIDEEQISIFGTNPKYLSYLEQEGVNPKEEFQLSSLKTILSTGSPLIPEQFDFIYREVKEDLCLSSISGGTDIIGCFALGNPLLPVRQGELQCRSLGYAVDVFSPDGTPLRGEKGELVCTKPFLSMPVKFWNDPDGERYHRAYFERFPGVWHHGDFASLAPEGGMTIYGRSDTVLNPGGVRIGTAEIYAQVERLPEISDSVVVGREIEGDVEIVLFVVLAEGAELSPELCSRIRSEIRENASPFHLPKKIVEVPDIPRTRSGKISELAVREVIHGRPVKNIDALANPGALEHFKDRFTKSSEQGS